MSSIYIFIYFSYATHCVNLSMFLSIYSCVRTQLPASIYQCISTQNCVGVSVMELINRENLSRRKKTFINLALKLLYKWSFISVRPSVTLEFAFNWFEFKLLFSLVDWICSSYCFEMKICSLIGLLSVWSLNLLSDWSEK